MIREKKLTKTGDVYRGMSEVAFLRRMLSRT